MSDTINFLTNDGEAAPADVNDIDLDELAITLDGLTDDELVSVAGDLELDNSGPVAAYKAIVAHLAEHNGTANVTDITHASAGAPATTMVSGENVSPDIVEQDLRTWLNPYTGNRVVQGCRDVDGRMNVDGKAILVPAANPAMRRNDAIYPSEMR